MPLRLPLFPLSLVLLPGTVLPLHVFEDRYRALVRDLLTRPEAERTFGVVAIRQGREVGADGVTALYEVGCVARLRQVQEHDDGRFDLVTTAAQRFRLHGLEHDRPYLTGVVELLDEPAGDGELPALAAAVQASYAEYLAALRATGADVAPAELAADGLALSYQVAGTVVLDLEHRQALLAQPDTTARLRSELTLLRREVRLIRELSATPAPELTRVPVSPN